MPIEPLNSFIKIEGILIDALNEVDRLGLILTGSRLQHAIDTLRLEWFDGAGSVEKGEQFH